MLIKEAQNLNFAMPVKLIKDKIGTKRSTAIKESGIEDYERTPEYWFYLGLAYTDNYQYKEAIVPFKQAIKIDPDDAGAHYNLACCYSLLGNVNKALESLGRAIDLGFDDIKHIENDSDLNGLRDEAGYKKLINKLKR